jgi:hypothetical protein
MYSVWAFLLLLFTGPSLGQVSLPTLLWKYGGPCAAIGCDNGGYTSPAIVDYGGATAVVGGFYAFAAVKGKEPYLFSLTM